MGATTAMILPSSAAALLVIVCLATSVSLAVPAQLSSLQERHLESAAESLVQEVNSAALAATASAVKTPGGPYGLALTPYMGWRSWNAYHNSVTQKLMEEVMDKLVLKHENDTSLQDLGYIGVGLDDNWQACGKGYSGSFHSADGTPLWNNVSFPDPVSMVTKAHKLGLKAGWYMNNCDCHETGLNSDFAEKIYRRSVAMIVEQQWDSVKLDGCSQFHNTTHWASLLEETGRPVAVENCGNTHPPTVVADPLWGHGGQCPYNWFRSSTDINPSWASIMNNLASTTIYQNLTHPLSVPGCWAYPDMLEVGNMATFEEDRAHFGAWCVVSSPLILGFDLTNDNLTAKVWPIISNREAINVNQQWVGHPGRLIKAWNPHPVVHNASELYLVAEHCNYTGGGPQDGFSYDTQKKAVVRAMGGHELCVDATIQSELRLLPCDGSVAQQWEYAPSQLPPSPAPDPPAPQPAELRLVSNPSTCIDIFCGPCHEGAPVQAAPCHNGTNQLFTFGKGMRDQMAQCLTAVNSPSEDPDSGARVKHSQLSLWAKAQPGNSQAVFLLSNQGNTSAPTSVEIEFSAVGMTGQVLVRDIWAHKDIGKFVDKYTTSPIGGHDSAFFLFSPSPSEGTTQHIATSQHQRLQKSGV